MHRILALLISVAVLLVGLLLAEIILSSKGDEAVRLVDQAEAVRTEIIRVLSDIESIETRLRGYLLTPQPIYVKTAESDKKALAFHMTRLRQLTADSPIQQRHCDELSHLIDMRLKRLDETVEIRKNQGLEATVQHLHTGQSRQIMGRIRAALAQMAPEHNELLAERRHALSLHQTILWVVLTFEIIAALVLLTLAFQSFRTHVRNESRRTVELLAAKNQAEEALAVKSRFLSTISHELRTPMAGVIGLAELLSLQQFGADTNATVRTLLESSKRLLQILNNLLDASRLESGKVKLEYRRFPARSLIGDVVQLVMPAAKQKQLCVYGSWDEQIPENLCGDELRVRQILLNLAFNAVKFSERGEIHIRAKLKEHTAESTIVRFSVSDTGIGISSELQAKIFDPFVQGHDSTTRVFGGTGLGLSINRELVELMDGQIGVISELGKGSTFWFEIPFVKSRCLP